MIGPSQTLQVANGRVQLGVANAVAGGGTLRILERGLLDMDGSPSPNSGTYHVADGGFLRLRNDSSLHGLRDNANGQLILDRGAFIVLNNRINLWNADPRAGYNPNSTTPMIYQPFEDVNLIIADNWFDNGHPIHLGEDNMLLALPNGGNNTHTQIAWNIPVRPATLGGPHDPRGGWVTIGKAAGPNQFRLHGAIEMAGVNIYINDDPTVLYDLPSVGGGDNWRLADMTLAPVALTGQVTLFTNENRLFQWNDTVVRGGTLRFGEGTNPIQAAITGSMLVKAGARLDLDTRGGNLPTKVREASAANQLFPGGIHVEQGGIFRIWWDGNQGTTITQNIRLLGGLDSPNMAVSVGTLFNPDSEGGDWQVVHFPNITIEEGANVRIQQIGRAHV